MSTIKQITTDLEFTQTLRFLSQAYEEIAVLKMQRIRSSVLSTREFLQELSSVFYDVKVNYDEMVKKAQAEEQKSRFRPSLFKRQFLTGKKNGKTVSVFLSSREKLYGDIIYKVFHLFQLQVFLLGRKNTSDIIIVGRYGKQLMDQTKHSVKYTFFDLPDANLTLHDLEPLLKELVKYEKVNVFYGKMDTVMNQQALVGSISGDTPLERSAQNKGTKRAFFFEPSIKEIMEFFETQVFYSLFYQTVHETELARLASRVKAMEEALGNIDRKEIELIKHERRLKKQLADKKQLSMLSGISLRRRSLVS